MRRLMAISLVAALLVMAVAVPAYATKPIPAGGDWFAAAPPGPDGCIPLIVTGTLVGTMDICQRPGGEGAELGYFVGSLGDAEGTLLINFSAQDYWAVLGGTGELANLHGQGVAPTDESGISGTYSGSMHFDP